MSQLLKTKVLAYTALWMVMLLSSTSAVLANTRDEVVVYLNDSLGSAVAAYSETGELCWEETYTPYGEKTVLEDMGYKAGCGLVGLERGFTGHVTDYDTGLVYMQQRYYDPTAGRFLSIDPVGPIIGDPRTINRYSYAANNPYKYIDPDGRFFFGLNVFRKDMPLEEALVVAGQSNAALSVVGKTAAIAATAITPGPEDLVMLGAVALNIPKFGKIADGAAGGNNLFRVVDDVELSDIQKTRAFRSPAGTFEEGKQFVDNIGDAKALQKQFSKLFGGNQTIVGAKAPQSVLDNSTKRPFADIPRGQAITVPLKHLPNVNPDI